MAPVVACFAEVERETRARAEHESCLSPLLTVPPFNRSERSGRESAPALRPSKLDCVLEPGTRVPDVHVWTAPREESRPLKEVLGTGRSYLCFYLWDCERATHRALPSARGLRGRRQGRRRYLVVREQTPSCACADDELTSRMRERSEREHPVEARRAASPRCEGLGSRAGRAARSSASGAASTTRTRERLRSSRHSRDRV